MKFSIQIDEKCEQASHKSTCVSYLLKIYHKNIIKNKIQPKQGDAFSLEPKSKYAIFGGEYNSTIVDLTDPTDIVKQIPIKTPLKWFVNNYDWDPFRGNERFIQSVRKISLIIIFVIIK